MLKWWGPAVALFTSFAGVSAHAAAKYECNVRVYDSNNFALIDEKFTANEFGGSHAQESNQLFASADGHTQIAVAVDGKWIIMNWTQNGAIVANALFAIQSPSQEARVAILYNPLNPDEQAALDCSPTTVP